jgi:hypothetical protein
MEWKRRFPMPFHKISVGQGLMDEIEIAVRRNTLLL